MLCILLVLLLSMPTVAIAQDHVVWIPVIIHTVPDRIINGDFEDGPQGWYQYSVNGRKLIEKSTSAHSGIWRVFLGGDWQEMAFIRQQVIVPAGKPYLTYWYWVPGGGDLCGEAFSWVIVNSDEIVDEYDLCHSTTGWTKRVIDFSIYKGQVITLQIQVQTGHTWWSNRSIVFIDDVVFQSLSHND